MLITHKLRNFSLKNKKVPKIKIPITNKIPSNKYKFVNISILENNSNGDSAPDIKENVTTKPMRRVNGAKIKTKSFDVRPIISP